MKQAGYAFTCARFLATIAIALVVGGCASQRAYHQGNREIDDGDLVGGVDKLREALRLDPENLEYRKAYFNRRDAVINVLLRTADLDIDNDLFDEADIAFREILHLDPENARALVGADRIDAARRLKVTLDAAEQATNGPPSRKTLEDTVARVRTILAERPNHRRAEVLYRRLSRQLADLSDSEGGPYPRLKRRYAKLVSLNLPSATLLQAFEALKAASGLNFVFDRDVKTDQRVALSLSDKPLEEVLHVLATSNQLAEQVLDDDTILIYPNMPQKASDYRELVVRSFYLSHADLTKTAAMLKTILKVRDVHTDEKLNLLIIRDSADVVRLAERLIANVDLADPEVMLELEILEVTHNRLTQLGIQWPSSVSANVTGAAGTAGELTLQELHSKSSGLVTLQFNSPLVAAQLLAQVSDSDLLANPRIRVKNRQTAKVLIGQRVPVITTTTTANVGTSESINYLDVGLKLEIEPTIDLDEEVEMKLALEVSSILSTLTLSSGSQAYVLGTRNAATTLRVRDNETQILGGLVQRDLEHSNNGIPGLNEIPILNRLFGQSSDTNDKTEVILLVTPHIVRSVDVPGPGQLAIPSGSESNTTGDAAPAARSQAGTPSSPGRSALPGSPTQPAAPRPVLPQAVQPSPANQFGQPTAPAFVAPPLVPATSGSTAPSVPTTAQPSTPAEDPH
jgi:general secretion pathway protein D